MIFIKYIMIERIFRSSVRLYVDNMRSLQTTCQLRIFSIVAVGKLQTVYVILRDFIHLHNINNNPPPAWWFTGVIYIIRYQRNSGSKLEIEKWLSCDLGNNLMRIMTLLGFKNYFSAWICEQKYYSLPSLTELYRDWYVCERHISVQIKFTPKYMNRRLSLEFGIQHVHKWYQLESSIFKNGW